MNIFVKFYKKIKLLYVYFSNIYALLINKK